jgi:hypothetical protein
VFSITIFDKKTKQSTLHLLLNLLQYFVKKEEEHIKTHIPFCFLELTVLSLVANKKMQLQTLSFSFFLVLSAHVFQHFRLAIGSVQVVETITVDKSGNGNFTTIQAAINSIPDSNSQWIRVAIHQGVYMYILISPLNQIYKHNVFFYLFYYSKLNFSF